MPAGRRRTGRTLPSFRGLPDFHDAPTILRRPGDVEHAPGCSESPSIDRAMAYCVSVTPGKSKTIAIFICLSVHLVWRQPVPDPLPIYRAATDIVVA